MQPLIPLTMQFMTRPLTQLARQPINPLTTHFMTHRPLTQLARHHMLSVHRLAASLATRVASRIASTASGSLSANACSCARREACSARRVSRSCDEGGRKGVGVEIGHGTVGIAGLSTHAWVRHLAGSRGCTTPVPVSSAPPSPPSPVPATTARHGTHDGMCEPLWYGHAGPNSLLPDQQGPC